jgi:hypothetical protein
MCNKAVFAQNNIVRIFITECNILTIDDSTKFTKCLKNYTRMYKKQDSTIYTIMILHV